jgi:hypothetical protein
MVVLFDVFLGMLAGASLAVVIWSFFLAYKHKGGRFRYRISAPKRKEVVIVEKECTNEQKVRFVINPITNAGNPAALDGAIAIIQQSGDASYEMIDDRSFWLISGINPGDSAFLVSGDADLGVGVENISEVIILKVAGAKAANLGIVAEDPVLK